MILVSHCGNREAAHLSADGKSSSPKIIVCMAVYKPYRLLLAYLLDVI